MSAPPHASDALIGEADNIDQFLSGISAQPAKEEQQRFEEPQRKNCKGIEPRVEARYRTEDQSALQLQRKHQKVMESLKFHSRSLVGVITSCRPMDVQRRWPFRSQLQVQIRRQ